MSKVTKPSVLRIYKVTTESKTNISTCVYKSDAKKKDAVTGELVEFDARPVFSHGSDPFDLVKQTITDHLKTLKGNCLVTVHVYGKSYKRGFKGLLA